MNMSMSRGAGSASGEKIKKIRAREILASGGQPSVEVRVELESGAVGIASVSYGASAGSKEAFVLFDGDEKRYNGKGMLTAVANVNEKIAPLLEDQESLSLRAADEIMLKADGSKEKKNFGANEIGRASCRERVCQYV